MTTEKDPAANVTADEESQAEPEVQEAQPAPLPLFDFTLPPKITIEDLYEHQLRHATFDDEDRRERMSPTVKRTVPKVDGEPAVSIVSDNGRAPEVYYNALAQTVSGYELPDGSIASQKPVKEKVLLNGPGSEEKILRDLLPAAHKLRVAALAYGGQFDIVKPEGRIRLGRSSETEITHKIGVEDLEDGSKSKPKNVIRYFVREATAAEISKFEGRGVNQVVNSIKGGGQEERRTVNMQVCVELADAVLTRIEGAQISKLAKDIEIGTVTGDKLAELPPSIKKTIAMIYFGHLVGLKGN